MVLLFGIWTVGLILGFGLRSVASAVDARSSTPPNGARLRASATFSQPTVSRIVAQHRMGSIRSPRYENRDEEQGMPISKKPRSKTAPKTSTKTSAAAALPDRRAMEGFLAAIAGRRGDDATAKAQDVMYEAWERTTPCSRIALARKALGISPLCADAYVLLAEEAARSIKEARDYYAGNWRWDHGASRSMLATSGAFSKHVRTCGPGLVSPAPSCSLATSAAPSPTTATCSS